MTETVSIGVDLGGTAIKAGAVRGGEVLSRSSVPTPQDEEACLQAIAAAAREVSEEISENGIGLGVPGVVQPSGDSVAGSPNLSFLARKPLASRVAEILGAPVKMGNDASLAALGEARHGAGAVHQDFFLVTLGTGVGGGLVLGGKLHTGPGMAGEIGHIRVDHQLTCACGAQGCLEAVLGAGPILELLREAGAEAPSLPEAGEQARSGDSESLEGFAQAGKHLGEALAQVALLLDVRVFLLGGGVSAVTDLLAPSAMAVLEGRAFGRSREDFLIEQATLGEDAGVIGAAAFALEG